MFHIFFLYNFPFQCMMSNTRMYNPMKNTEKKTTYLCLLSVFSYDCYFK